MSLTPRRKQPEKVRRDLLDAAARIATRAGVQTVTVEAVSAEAGVTKGAFFHHFPSKQALVSAVFHDLIDRLDAYLADAIAADPLPHGRFTRAYIHAVTEPDAGGSDGLWIAVYFATLSNAELRDGWRDWLAGRLADHAEDGPDIALQTARFAADGIWLGMITGSGPAPDDLARLRAHLVALTLP
jgi:AcrR family transcriptional regulator